MTTTLQTITVLSSAASWSVNYAYAENQAELGGGRFDPTKEGFRE